MAERRSFFMDLSVGESMRLHTGVEIDLRSKDGAKATLTVRVPESACLPDSAVPKGCEGVGVFDFYELRRFLVPSFVDPTQPRGPCVRTGGRKGRQVGLVMSTSDIVTFPGDIELTAKFKKGQKARFLIKTLSGQDVKKILMHERTPLQAGHSDVVRTR